MELTTWILILFNFPGIHGRLDVNQRLQSHSCMVEHVSVCLSVFFITLTLKLLFTFVASGKLSLNGE